MHGHHWTIMWIFAVCSRHAHIHLTYLCGAITHAVGGALRRSHAASECLHNFCCHVFMYQAVIWSFSSNSNSVSLSLRHSLLSWEKRRLRGKVKVGEAGLVATAGAEFIPPLDTTEEAGTWRARRSALGLVGSSVGGVERRKGEEEGKEGRKDGRQE